MQYSGIDIICATVCFVFFFYLSMWLTAWQLFCTTKSNAAFPRQGIPLSIFK